VRTVFVTGGAGMIGTAVVRRLLVEPKVSVRMADMAQAPAWMAKEVECHVADLREVETCRRLMTGCTQVIHLAAIVGGIANFHRLPLTLTEVNNALYNSVFRAAVDAQVERFVLVSSSMVFERAEVFPTPEEYLSNCPVPLSAYGFSKLTGEVYCRAAAEEVGLRYTICRPFNAYGPGEFPKDEPGIAHAVPDLIRKALAHQRPLKIFGSGSQTRTLTHVDDIANGIVTAMVSDAAVNEDFNISAEQEMRIAELAALIWELCGRSKDEFELESLPSFRVDVQRRWPSVAKARKLLGWRAQTSLSVGLAQTIDWLKQSTGRESTALQS
jgi:UDP-glucose 4-epimerase